MGRDRYMVLLQMLHLNNNNARSDDPKLMHSRTLSHNRFTRTKISALTKVLYYSKADVILNNLFLPRNRLRKKKKQIWY